MHWLRWYPVDLWVEMTNPQVASSAATNEKPFSFQFIYPYKKQAEHEYDQNSYQ